MSFFGPNRPCGLRGAAGTVPSAPFVGFRRLQAFGERVFYRQRSVRDRNLAPPRDAQLLAQGIVLKDGPSVTTWEVKR